MASDADTKVRLSVEDGFTGTLKEFKGQIAEIPTQFSSASSAITSSANLVKGALGAIGASLSIGLVVDEFKKAVGIMASLDDAAEMVGSSVENVSRLMGVAAESGKSLDDVVGITAKLQSAMIGAEQDTGRAAEAFKALGLNLGEFDDSTDALIAFAKGLNQYEDGANKTQLAIAVLGKAGAQALPFLKDLANAGELQARVTTEQAATAEQYEKAMARSAYATEQFKVQIVGSMLPTMLGLIDQFKQARAAGLGFLDALNTIPFAMSKLEQIEDSKKKIAGLKTEMESLGKVRLFFDPGAEERLAVQLAGEEKRLGILTNQGRAQGLLRTQAEELYGPKGYGERAAALQAPALANEKNIKAAADAAKKLADAYADLIKNITSKNAETQQELANQGKLTEAQKFEMDARGKLADILDQLSPKQRANVESIIREGVTLRDSKAAMEAQTEASKAAAKVREDLAKATVQRIEGEWKHVEALQQSITKQEDENDRIGLTKIQLAELEVKRSDDARALLVQRLAAAEKGSQDASEIEAIRIQLELSGELIKARERGAALTKMNEDAQAAQKAWKEASETIEKSLTDALMRGFEGGKDFVQNLVATMKNLFNTLVLKPIIQATVQPLAAGALGFLGLGGTANAGTGTGGIGNVLSGAGGLSNLFSGSGSLASLFGAGAGVGGAATTFATSGLGTMLGLSETVGGVGVGLTGAGSSMVSALSAIPGWGWAIAGGLALAGILGKKRGGPKTGGSFSTTGERLFTPDSADAEAGQLGQSALTGIADLAKQLGGTAAGLSLGIGFDSDPQGTAGNRISSFLRDASGRSLFDNISGRDVGRDDSALQTGLGDETSKLILAGLKASDLPTAVRDYLGTINVATFTAAQLDSVIAAAKALVPAGAATPEQTLLDRALEDPGTYTAVSTEVRSLVTLQQDHLDVAKEQRDAQLKAGELLLAQLDQAKNAFMRLIEAADRGALNTARLVDQGVALASVPLLVRVI